MTLYVLYKRKGCSCHSNWLATHAWINDEDDDGEYLLNYTDPQSQEPLSKSFDSELEAEEFITDNSIKSYKLYNLIGHAEDDEAKAKKTISIDDWVKQVNHYETYYTLKTFDCHNIKANSTIYLCDLVHTIYETRAEAEAHKVRLERQDKYRHQVFELVVEGQRPAWTIVDRQ
jgi:hypothetical protein